MSESIADDYDVSAANLKGLAEKLNQLLCVRTLAIGMKLIEDAGRMAAVPGVRTPTEGFHFTTCQLVTQARTAGFALGIVHATSLGRRALGLLARSSRPVTG